MQPFFFTAVCSHPLFLTVSLQNKLGFCRLDSQEGDKTSPGTDSASSLAPPPCPLQSFKSISRKNTGSSAPLPDKSIHQNHCLFFPFLVLMFPILRVQSRNCHLILHSFPWRFRGTIYLAVQYTAIPLALHSRDYEFIYEFGYTILHNTTGPNLHNLSLPLAETHSIIFHHSRRKFRASEYCTDFHTQSSTFIDVFIHSFSLFKLH